MQVTSVTSPVLFYHRALIPPAYLPPPPPLSVCLACPLFSTTASALVAHPTAGLHDGDFTFTAGQTARAKWLIVRSRKARYALRLCMQQILDSTYTEHSIPDLRRVRDRLQTTYSRVVQQHQTLTAALQVCARQQGKLWRQGGMLGEGGS